MFYLTFLEDLELSLFLFSGLDDFGMLVLGCFVLESPVKAGAFYADSIDLLFIDCNQSWIYLITKKKFLYSFHGNKKLDELTNKHWKRSDGLVDDVENCDDRDSKRKVNFVSRPYVGGETYTL